jgi:hypothetical protein
MQHNAMQFLDLRRIVKEYPVCRRKVYQLIKDERLKAFRFDGKLIVKRADLEQLFTEKRVHADLDTIVEETISELSR